MLPMPPPNLVNPNLIPPRPRRENPTRAKELTDIGDRSFRAGNTKRAEEKFNLAAKADVTAPAPHVHLALVSLARGDYAAAADHLRDAVTVVVNNEWLLNAPDIQAIFAEPRDFGQAAHLVVRRRNLGDAAAAPQQRFGIVEPAPDPLQRSQPVFRCCFRLPFKRTYR